MAHKITSCQIVADVLRLFFYFFASLFSTQLQRTKSYSHWLLLLLPLSPLPLSPSLFCCILHRFQFLSLIMSMWSFEWSECPVSFSPVYLPLLALCIPSLFSSQNIFQLASHRSQLYLRTFCTYFIYYRYI